MFGEIVVLLLLLFAAPEVGAIINDHPCAKEAHTGFSHCQMILPHD